MNIRDSCKQLKGQSDRASPCRLARQGQGLLSFNKTIQGSEVMGRCLFQLHCHAHLTIRVACLCPLFTGGHKSARKLCPSCHHVEGLHQIHYNTCDFHLLSFSIYMWYIYYKMLSRPKSTLNNQAKPDILNKQRNFSDDDRATCHHFLHWCNERTLFNGS